MATADTQQTESMVDVMYVGRKPFAVDNVAGSGQTWTGNGDVKPVTEDEALVLEGFPDQWQRAPKTGEPPTPAQVDANAKAFFAKDGKATAALKRPPRDRTLAELQKDAKRKYGAILKSKSLKGALEELAALEEDDEHERGVGLSAATVKSVATRKAPPAKSAKKR